MICTHICERISPCSIGVELNFIHNRVTINSDICNLIARIRLYGKSSVRTFGNSDWLRRLDCSAHRRRTRFDDFYGRSYRITDNIEYRINIMNRLIIIAAYHIFENVRTRTVGIHLNIGSVGVSVFTHIHNLMIRIGFYTERNVFSASHKDIRRRRNAPARGRRCRRGDFALIFCKLGRDAVIGSYVLKCVRTHRADRIAVNLDI